MRKNCSSGSVEGVMGNHDPYSDRFAQDDRQWSQNVRECYLDNMHLLLVLS